MDKYIMPECFGFQKFSPVTDMLDAKRKFKKVRKLTESDPRDLSGTECQDNKQS